MATPEKIKAKTHMFMPGETITAAIKKYNLYDVTKEEMILLLKTFVQLNSADNPRPGIRVMIPILPRHHLAAFLPVEKKITS